MEKSFLASLTSLPEMLAFVKGYAYSAGFQGDSLTRIELAAEEALVNIIENAYEKTSEGQITIECTDPNSNGIKICIRDDGRAFDPIKAAQNQKQSGYGLQIMVKAMDSVDYQRQGDTNVLTLIKHQEFFQ